MNTTHKIASVMLTLVLGLGMPAVVSARSLRDARADLKTAREEMKAEQKSLIQELRARISSRASEMKGFLGFGRAAIGSGTLTAKTDTTMTVEKDGKSYTVNFDSKTQFRRRFWGKAELSEFNVGDTVNVIGLWSDDTRVAINARLIRNLSIQKRFGVFFGEVKSLLGSGWVMSTRSDKRADQTVTVSASTKYENRNGETITQTDVKAGHRVRVRGLWDRTLNTVTEVTNVKDFSLPVRVEVEATVTATP